MLLPELHKGRLLVDPVLRHGQGSLVQRVDVAHDEHEVGGLLDGQEPRARDVDDEATVLEELDGRSDVGLQL